MFWKKETTIIREELKHEKCFSCRAFIDKINKVELYTGLMKYDLFYCGKCKKEYDLIIDAPIGSFFMNKKITKPVTFYSTRQVEVDKNGKQIK